MQETVAKNLHKLADDRFFFMESGIWKEISSTQITYLPAGTKVMHVSMGKVEMLNFEQPTTQQVSFNYMPIVVIGVIAAGLYLAPAILQGATVMATFLAKVVVFLLGVFMLAIVASALFGGHTSRHRAPHATAQSVHITNNITNNIKI